MKSTVNVFAFAAIGILLFSCAPEKKTDDASVTKDTTRSFEYVADRFADIQVLRYQVPGFDELPLQKKQLAYYLAQAGLSGRDIFYDQKYKHGLLLRKTLEAILNSSKEPRSGDSWEQFEIYCKRFFFANGIHHHYSSDKMIPNVSNEYFAGLIKSSDTTALPLDGKSVDEFIAFVTPLFFDPKVDPKTVDLSAEDVVVG